MTTLTTQVGGGERKRTDRSARLSDGMSGMSGMSTLVGPGWMPPWELGLGYTRRIPIRGDILPLASH
jgi:hypothetical protein